MDQWRHSNTPDNRIMQLVQIVESAHLTCASFCDSEILASGTSDNMVTIWRMHRSPSSSPKLKLSHLMRGHESAVLCINASRPWSLIVSGSEDGTAIFWDLNRAQYVRTIRHDRPVHSCAINGITVSFFAITQSKPVSERGAIFRGTW